MAYKSIVPPAALQFGNQYVEDAHIRIDSINHLSYSDTVRDGSDMQDVKSRFESDYLTMLRVFRIYWIFSLKQSDNSRRA